MRNDDFENFFATSKNHIRFRLKKQFHQKIFQDNENERIINQNI